MKACPRCKNAPGGDKGQRFMIVGTFRGVADHPLAYCVMQDVAEAMLDGFNKWPAVRDVRIVDRHLSRK